MTKIPSKPKNYQNTLEIQKIIKIPLKSKKLPKYPWNLKMTKIPPKPKKWPKYPKNPKNDQNTLETQKMTKVSPKPKKWPKYPKNLKMTKIPLDIAPNQWGGWSGFGGTTDGGGRPAKSKRSQRGNRRWPAKPPPMIKLVSQEWSFGCLEIKS